MSDWDWELIGYRVFCAVVLLLILAGVLGFLGGVALIWRELLS